MAVIVPQKYKKPIEKIYQDLKQTWGARENLESMRGQQCHSMVTTMWVEDGRLQRVFTTKTHFPIMSELKRQLFDIIDNFDKDRSARISGIMALQNELNMIQIYVEQSTGKMIVRVAGDIERKS